MALHSIVFDDNARVINPATGHFGFVISNRAGWDNLPVMQFCGDLFTLLVIVTDSTPDSESAACTTHQQIFSAAIAQENYQVNFLLLFCRSSRL